MTNIREISKRTGYSVSTVSRVLNQHPHVSDEARQKILQVVQELDYTPNLVAKELSIGNAFRVGVVIPHVRHSYFTTLINGMIDQAQQTNYKIVLLPSQYDSKMELKYLEELRGHAYDHLIFTSRNLDLETIASYSKYGNLLCLEEVIHPLVSSVYIDRRLASQEAFYYLKEKGYQSLALLFTRTEQKSSTYRMMMESYEKVYGTESQAVVIDGIATEEDGYQKATILMEHPEIDAIFTNGDDIAAGVLRAYQEAGRNCPFLIGQGNRLEGRLLGIPSIDHKSYQVGKEAFKQVLSKEKKTIILQSEFVKR